MTSNFSRAETGLPSPDNRFCWLMVIWGDKDADTVPVGHLNPIRNAHSCSPQVSTEIGKHIMMECYDKHKAGQQWFYLSSILFCTTWITALLASLSLQERQKGQLSTDTKIGLSCSTAALFQQAALPQQLLKLKKINKMANLLTRSICCKYVGVV